MIQPRFLALGLCFALGASAGARAAGSTEGESYRETQIRQWMMSLARGWVQPAPEPELPLTCQGADQQTGLLEPYPSPTPSQGLAAESGPMDEKGRLCRFSAIDRLDLSVLSPDKRVSSKLIPIRRVSSKAVCVGCAIEVYDDRGAYFLLVRRSTKLEVQESSLSQKSALSAFTWYEYQTPESSPSRPSLSKLLARIQESFDHGRFTGSRDLFQRVEGWPLITSRAVAVLTAPGTKEFRLVGRPTTIEYLREVLAKPEGLKGPASSQLIDAIELAYGDDGRMDADERALISKEWRRLREHGTLSREATRFQNFARAILHLEL